MTQAGSAQGPITGERVSTAIGGFNPTWQRHAAAYEQCAGLLPPGRVLDLGCGTGHSYQLLAPRESVGVDADADALAGQDRPTYVADMRSLPFGDGEFDSVLSVHSLEHVPDPERVLGEARRVLKPDGVAVFVTPNALTFGRDGEIIDPYHYVEFTPDHLEAACGGAFGSVEVLGLFGSRRYLELVAEERRRLDRLLRMDPLGMRRRVPRRMRQRLYDRLLVRNRTADDPAAAAIGREDFSLGKEKIAESLDLIAVCSGTA